MTRIQWQIVGVTSITVGILILGVSGLITPVVGLAIGGIGGAACGLT